MAEVQLELDSNCKGVTSETGQTFTADKGGRVNVPGHLAESLKASGAARPSRRLYGGFTLPTSPTK